MSAEKQAVTIPREYLEQCGLIVGDEHHQAMRRLEGICYQLEAIARELYFYDIDGRADPAQMTVERCRYEAVTLAFGDMFDALETIGTLVANLERAAAARPDAG